MSSFSFFFNDTATTEIYTLSLHDALPISSMRIEKICASSILATSSTASPFTRSRTPRGDRKSTRLNSSHMSISYAVFCLKKKKRRATQDGQPRHHEIVAAQGETPSGSGDR